MCVLLESSPLSVALKSQSGASTGFEFWQYKGSDKFQGYKNCLNSLISAPIPSWLVAKVPQNASFQSLFWLKRLGKGQKLSSLKFKSLLNFRTFELGCEDHQRGT